MTAFSRSRLTISILGLAHVLVLTIACGDDSPTDDPSRDAATGGDSSRDMDAASVERSASTPDGTTDQSRSNDADPSRRRTVNGAGCSTVDLGSLVMPTMLSTTPAFMGGAVRDGVYEATAQELRTGTSRDQVAWTLEVRGGSYSSASLVFRADAVLADFEDRGRGEVSTTGTVLSLRRACGGTEVRSFDYTATDRELVLHSNGVLWRLQRR